MKAVKSDLARQLLADPAGRTQIRNSIMGQSPRTGPQAPMSPAPVVVSQDGTRYARVVIPKAA